MLAVKFVITLKNEINLCIKCKKTREKLSPANNDINNLYVKIKSKTMPNNIY